MRDSHPEDRGIVSIRYSGLEAWSGDATDGAGVVQRARARGFEMGQKERAALAPAWGGHARARARGRRLRGTSDRLPH